MRLKPGQILGPYKITRFIARGGMGEIYEAYEERLERRVALKIISGKHEESENYRENLIKEARALAKVNHSNVVSVFSIDTLEGIDFIAMEYIDGIPMDKVTERFAFDTVEIFNICMQMLQGLKALHDRNIVHRDIKPSNILLTDQGVIKWADFGLAAVLDQVNQNTVSNLYGTPRYLSPEQLQGMATSFPSDIWCLGLVFYEMLAGEKLIDPKKVMTLLEIEEFIMGLDFDIPLQLRRSVHPVFQNILKQMLSRDLTNRYKNIDDVISDFKTLEMKIAKEKKVNVFGLIRRSLPDYKAGWQILGQNTRLSDFQKKRMMALSLRFRPKKSADPDETVNLQEEAKAKYFSKEALDSAQHLWNRQARVENKSASRAVSDLSDSMIIYPDSTTGRIQMIDTSMKRERAHVTAYKSFKWVYLAVIGVSALLLLFADKTKVMNRIDELSKNFIEDNPEMVKEYGKEVMSERQLAAIKTESYPSDTTVWFTPGAPIMFEWRGLTFEDEAVMEIATDPKMKSVFLKEVVTGSNVAVNWLRSGQYYWRVRSFDYSKTTEIHQFLAYVSSPPELIIPGVDSRFTIKEEEYFNEKNIQFFWKKKTAVTSYHVQVAKTRDFSRVKAEQTVSNTQNWSAKLTPGIYYWRVRAADEGVDSGWSKPRKFDIVTEKF